MHPVDPRGLATDCSLRRRWSRHSYWCSGDVGRSWWTSRPTDRWHMWAYPSRSASWWPPWSTLWVTSPALTWTLLLLLPSQRPDTSPGHRYNPMRILIPLDLGQGEMLWRQDLVKPRELLLSRHFTPWTLTKAKCPDDKTLLHLERSCYGSISPLGPWQGKMPSRQDLVKAGEVLPWGHSPWPRCRGAKAKCPDGKTSGPLYLIFPLLHLGVQRCVEL